MPNIPDVVGIRPSRTSRSERPQASSAGSGMAGAINHAEVSPILRTRSGKPRHPQWNEVMRRLRHGRATIYRHFPDSLPSDRAPLCGIPRKMCLARKAYAAEEVKRVAIELHAKG